MPAINYDKLNLTNIGIVQSDIVSASAIYTNTLSAADSIIVNNILSGNNINLSDRWNTSYTFSNSNSALILGDLTNIANTSATWDISYTNLVNNSGAYLAGVNLSNIAAVSSNWNTSYTFLTSNSALILGDLTDIAVTSATWNTSYTFTNSNSALILGDLTVLATNSAYWNPGVGINGGTLFALNSAMILGDLTDIAVTSANWNNTYTQFSNNSATYATIPYVNSNFLSTSGGLVNGTTSFAQNLSVLGSLFVTGSAVFANALIVTSTSALSVVNTGTGPALFVGQGPGGGDIASFYDNNNGLEVLHIGNDLPYIGKGVIGIRTSDPNETLTVIGGISSTGVISTSAYDSNSNNWTNAWTNLVGNSGAYLSGANLSEIASVSANWNTSYTFLTSNSALILGDLTNIAVTSATWDISYTNLVGNSAAYLSGANLSQIASVSANWNTSYTFLTSNSALILGDLTDISVTSAYWNTSYTFLTSNSALILGDLTNISVTSSTWDISYTNLVGNSAAYLSGANLSEIAAVSANWNTSYTFLTSNSALILGDLTDIANTSATWNNAWTNLVNNSGAYLSGANLSDIAAVSANWNTSYSFLTSNSALILGDLTNIANTSANWNTSYTFLTSNSALILGDLTNISVTSANWNTSYTFANSNSALILGDLTVVATNSAFWNPGVGVNGGTLFALNSAMIFGDLTDISVTSANWNASYSYTNSNSANIVLQNSSPTLSSLTVLGNLSVLGDFTYLDTTVTVTSALSVVNVGTGPALTVKQSGSQPVATFIDAEGGYMTIADTGSVGIGTQSPNEKLSVIGNISASGIVYANLGNSNNWNSSYTFTNSNSALILGDLTVVATNSAYWGNASGGGFVPLSGTNVTSMFGQLSSTASATFSGLTITTGNVGIRTAGLTNPFNTRLDVLGGVSFRTDSGDSTKALLFDSSGTSHRIYTDSSAGTAYNLILGTYPNGTTTQLVLQQSTGNVGIGTATPVTKLTVVGNISATGRTFLSAVEFRDGTFQTTAAAGGGASGGLYVPLSGTNGGSMFGQLSSTGGATFSALTIGGGSTTIIGTVSTFTNVMTASNDFLLITVSGKTRGIRLYDF